VFTLVRADLSNRHAMEELFTGAKYDAVVNLAAQAGVRYSLENPYAYVDANVVGFMNILEGVRHHGTGHLVFASTSSVYGTNPNLPYKEDDDTDHPVSLYAATKKANEAMAHSYAHLFGIPSTGLRFFTVYGPWGRPDMAYWLFTDAVLHERPLPVYGGGRLRRDFTYIDDIVSALVRIVETPFAWDQGAPHRLYNLGNSHPEEVQTLIRCIEQATGKTARIEDADAPPGDVRETYADTSRASRDFGFTPAVPLAEGIARFVRWFREYHGL
jgi:UDP-glucuronate 4-epimerase